MRAIGYQTSLPSADPASLTDIDESMQTCGGSRRCFCCLVVVIRGPEARIALTKGVLERVVQHGCAYVEEGLHGRPVPAHLLRLVHALGHDRVNRTLHERG